MGRLGIGDGSGALSISSIGMPARWAEAAVTTTTRVINCSLGGSSSSVLVGVMLVRY